MTARALAQARQGDLPVVNENALNAFSVSASGKLSDVAENWRGFEAQGIDSPGQSFDFVRCWIARNRIAEKDCLFISARINERPLALLPLVRTAMLGGQAACFFAGDHVGCNGPLFDRAAFGALTHAEKASVWRRMLKLAVGVDIVLMPNIIAEHGREMGLDAAFSRTAAPDFLYRAEFADWAQCDLERRDKKKRKIDRQQRAKLEALGAVSFESVGPGAEGRAIIEIMFAQRARRFEMQGIADPFAAPEVRAFYMDLFEAAGGVLQVLRLNGEPVAVRYNIPTEDRLHCLISSMSWCEVTQTGSPGKQALLHVMQNVFDEGWTSFDMGKGLTDEKKLWCNKVIDLDCYHHARTPLGHMMMLGHQARMQAKGMIKNNSILFDMFRQVRKRLG
ncbi:GNAT family N-acetyltransferase [Pelagibacterium lentulum]|uniref:BioF2-like acetyltransferase domain-containing protein n=1 Tax=Pelagibacterium lentulum TaxID=2029865 RepID=A0A916RAF9_9HYPH|nr:GNAT family N-acetyltransferase [Pelagibacterium lentulum]GGA48183.1 hypothetical protein GCM10011499_17570 [Pelagibacterium lentulum]